MRRINTTLVLAFDDWMTGDQLAILKDLQLGYMMLDFQGSASCRIRHRVMIAANQDHTVLGDTPLNRQHRAVGIRWQLSQGRELLGECLINNASRRGMDARVCNLHPPSFELCVEIIQIPERPTEEKVLPDVAEWPFYLAFRLGPISLTGARRAVIMGQERDLGWVVGDNAIGTFANHRRLHPVIENLFRRTADGFESRHMAPHHGL